MCLYEEFIVVFLIESWNWVVCSLSFFFLSEDIEGCDRGSGEFMCRFVF